MSLAVDGNDRHLAIHLTPADKKLTRSQRRQTSLMAHPFLLELSRYLKLNLSDFLEEALVERLSSGLPPELRVREEFMNCLLNNLPIDNFHSRQKLRSATEPRTGVRGRPKKEQTYTARVFASCRLFEGEETYISFYIEPGETVAEAVVRARQAEALRRAGRGETVGRPLTVERIIAADFTRPPPLESA